ncbi:MAG: TIM barrel protein [Pelosinus sp.]|nr:TIM barrel protein [Pelosinus sp.]
MESYASFGPAGNPDAFYLAGHKASLEMPAWLQTQGLTAYEYQCSRGVNIKEETARNIGSEARLHGVKLSIHAPYYISLATNEPKIAENTLRHFMKALETAAWMGADRVVFHIGGPGKQARDTAIEVAKNAFLRVLEERERKGFAHINLAPETMGKQNQLGSVAEVLSFCKLAAHVIPAVDFGHLHAVTGGLYTKAAEYAAVFEQVSKELGAEIAGNLHIHFSKIEFTKAGEKKHWTFADSFGPPHAPLLAVCALKHFTPRIICESAGTQAKDAKDMQELYRSLLVQRDKDV